MIVLCTMRSPKMAPMKMVVMYTLLFRVIACERACVRIAMRA